MIFIQIRYGNMCQGNGLHFGGKKNQKNNELCMVNGYRLMVQILMKNIPTGKLWLLIHIDWFGFGF